MADINPPDGEVLSAPLTIEYPFRRSVGPILGAFFTGLREGVVVGVKRSNGSVLVPPSEYDPETAEALDDLVEVGQSGIVTAWSWVNRPRDKHLFDRPFAWALVRLDGADTGLLHMVDAGDASKMSTGMRVKIKWAEERVGHINDIVCFVPEDGAGA